MPVIWVGTENDLPRSRRPRSRFGREASLIPFCTVLLIELILLLVLLVLIVLILLIVLIILIVNKVHNAVAFHVLVIHGTRRRGSREIDRQLVLQYVDVFFSSCQYFVSFSSFCFHESAALRSIVVRYPCAPANTRSWLTTNKQCFVLSVSSFVLFCFVSFLFCLLEIKL